MKSWNKGVKVLRKHENKIIGVRVELTQKTTMAGKIIYAVVLTNLHRHKHYKIHVYDGIGKAWNYYKAALA